MSRIRQSPAADLIAVGDPPGAILVVSFAGSTRRTFDRHVHDWHQVAWAARGVVTVEAPGGTWILPTTRALWIPAGIPHVTTAYGTLSSPYFRPETCPIDWAEPTVINVPPLLRELIVRLADPSLSGDARARTEAVVADLLEPVRTTAIEVPLPSDDRAHRVAEALLADPADDRSLDAWGRTVGASGRTLTRVFEAETGMGFARWRTQARLRAAVELLAEGVPVTTVAHRVGYATPSAFVSVFRRSLGVSPGSYFTSS
jgi:AraC-like DNA-binding protein